MNRYGYAVVLALVVALAAYAFWPQALRRLVHDLEVSRDEFWEWSNAGRRAR